MNAVGPYEGMGVAFPTKHGKERVLQPPFEAELRAHVRRIEADTDAFGTFSGEIPRIATPVETAIAKAQLGLEGSDLTLAVGSEGSIGSDPAMPFVVADHEILAFIDSERDITIVESLTSTEIVAVRQVVQADAPLSDLEDLLRRADFPRHALIVHGHNDASSGVVKGIQDIDQLATAIARVGSDDGDVIIESDLRAVFSPSRMANIRACAERLARRIGTLCPRCSAPGWGLVEPIRGVPCRGCGTIAPQAIRADREACTVCTEVHEYPRSEATIEPRWCQLCNP